MGTSSSFFSTNMGRSYNIVWLFHKDKKRSKLARQTHFFKKDEILLFNYGLFQQASLTCNDNLRERSEKIEAEDRIQDVDAKDEETVLGFLTQYEFYGYLKRIIMENF